MKLRSITIKNVRSFMESTTFSLEQGDISIIVGPNGGGKTNLLDTTITCIKKYIMPPWTSQSPGGDERRFQFTENPNLHSLRLQKHALAEQADQEVTIEVEVTEQDIKNMEAIKADMEKMVAHCEGRYFNIPFSEINLWNIDNLVVGTRIFYRVINESLIRTFSDQEVSFVSYMRNFDWISHLRGEAELTPISNPLLYLTIIRGAAGFQSNVSLSNFDYQGQKQNADITTSRTGGGIIGLAIGRLAQKYITLLHAHPETFESDFYDDPQIKRITELMGSLDYTWKLKCVNIYTNTFEIEITKQGTTFSIDGASSGEKEIFFYLFSIYALNVKDALIIVDEPELHLHPKWQKLLLAIFEQLSASTGNQFLLATHSATFISPKSIQYVSRVFIESQKSKVVRLNSPYLPNAKHLFAIINSHNNESIFFADKVILVEGLSDKLFFESVLARFGAEEISSRTINIVSVGGKGYFPSYIALLQVCKVSYAVVADLDYVEQVGSNQLKSFFRINNREIKQDVVENIKSLDGAMLVSRINEALEEGSWDNARQVWEYIKSKRVMLDENLNEVQKEALYEFIDNKYSENLFILKQGSLEKYLPIGYRSKDVDKLIQLLGYPNYWSLLDVDLRSELEGIAKGLLKIQNQS